jgi:hypothetical protein
MRPEISDKTDKEVSKAVNEVLEDTPRHVVYNMNFDDRARTLANIVQENADDIRRTSTFD